MEKLKSLPGQIILTIDNLMGDLQSAAQADTIEAVREMLAAAIERAEVINQLCCNAQFAVDAEATGK